MKDNQELLTVQPLSFKQIEPPSIKEREEIGSLPYEVMLVESEGGQWYLRLGQNSDVDFDYRELNKLNPARIIHVHSASEEDEKAGERGTVWRSTPSPEDVQSWVRTVQELGKIIPFEIWSRHGSTEYTFKSMPSVDDDSAFNFFM